VVTTDTLVWHILARSHNALRSLRDAFPKIEQKASDDSLKSVIRRVRGEISARIESLEAVTKEGPFSFNLSPGDLVSRTILEGLDAIVESISSPAVADVWIIGDLLRVVYINFGDLSTALALINPTEKVGLHTEVCDLRVWFESINVTLINIAEAGINQGDLS